MLTDVIESIKRPETEKKNKKIEIAVREMKEENWDALGANLDISNEWMNE